MKTIQFIFLTSFLFSQMQINPDSVSAPLTPTIYATSGNGGIIISWDDIAQKSIDKATGYADFEGYRIYRSIDNGETWGSDEDRIYDYQGNHVGWRPIAQFDYNGLEDGLHCIYTHLDCGSGLRRGEDISGIDPYNPRSYLGDNTGIVNSYFDEDVIEGIEYTYSVTSYDMGLRTFEVEFTDDNNDGIFIADTTWSTTNPERFVLIDTLENGEIVFSGIQSNECEIGQSENDSNFITFITGVFASNITFPNEEELSSFFSADSENIGTGSADYSIVDLNDLKSELLKFEVNARYSENTANGLAVENSAIFVYSIDNIDDQSPTQIDTMINISGVGDIELDSLLGLPGAQIAGDVISIPYYKAIVDPSNGPGIFWSELFDGFKVKFEDYATSEIFILAYNLSPIQSFNWHADSSTINSLNVDIRFGNSYSFINDKLSFDYRIEFGSSAFDTAKTTGTSRIICNNYNFMPTDAAGLPFKITNTSSDSKVYVLHRDYGLNDVITPSEESPGRLDCIWSDNEMITFKDVWYMRGDPTDTTYWESVQTFNLNISFRYNEENFPMQYLWDNETQYSIGDKVYYEALIWEASEDILEPIEPIVFIDTNNDSINENPWVHYYPWKDGDYLDIITKKFFTDGDYWIADMSLLGKSHYVTGDELDSINVVPNPYIVNSAYNETSEQRRIRFTHLPQQCRIQIFTLFGERVVSLVHDDNFDGNLFWDLRSENNQEIAPGLYIYVVESDDKKHVGKFAVVR